MCLIKTRHNVFGHEPASTMPYPSHLKRAHTRNSCFEDRSKSLPQSVDTVPPLMVLLSCLEILGDEDADVLGTIAGRSTDATRPSCKTSKETIKSSVCKVTNAAHSHMHAKLSSRPPTHSSLHAARNSVCTKTILARLAMVCGR